MDGLRVRLHGLKVWCKKRVPVMPLVQHACPPCGEERRVRHAKRTKYGAQIRLHEIERSHLCLGVVFAACCNDEGRLLTKLIWLGVRRFMKYLSSPPAGPVGLFCRRPDHIGWEREKLRLLRRGKMIQDNPAQQMTNFGRDRVLFLSCFQSLGQNVSQSRLALSGTRGTKENANKWKARERNPQNWHVRKYNIPRVCLHNLRRLWFSS